MQRVIVGVKGEHGEGEWGSDSPWNVGNADILHTMHKAYREVPARGTTAIESLILREPLGVVMGMNGGWKRPKMRREWALNQPRMMRS
jgi:hypothetical protein